MSPSPRAELNGELGLDLHEIAKAMGLEFSTVKRKRDELKNLNEISDTTICRIVKTGFAEREVESAILDVDNAKLLVTQLGGKLSIAFCRHLIETEKRYQEQSLNLATLFTDPRKGIEFMTKVAALIESRDELEVENTNLKRRQGEISRNREVSRRLTSLRVW